ncbi:MAG: hypothetical protein HKN24_13045 [Acidimicrobiales bacterium]|nr:hypothetical protein [Acidimicrobiales bacterium]
MSGESAPEYDGHCAFAISLGKSDEQQSGAHKLVQNGRTFHFRNPVAKFLFKTLNRSEKADAHWERRA